MLALCQDRRGTQRDMTQHGKRVQVRYLLPLAEVVADFHDRIKSATRGYGSFDYELAGYQPGDLVKLDVLVNGRAGGRALADRAPRQVVPARLRSGAQAQGIHSAPDVRGGDPGGRSARA